MPTNTTKAAKVDLDSMTTEERVKYHYEHAQGSIQDIARVYRLTVDEVLHIIGQDELAMVNDNTVDMIDKSEAGTAPLKLEGTNHPVQFDIN